MSRLQNSRQRGKLNLSISIKCFIRVVPKPVTKLCGYMHLKLSSQADELYTLSAYRCDRSESEVTVLSDKSKCFSARFSLSPDICLMLFPDLQSKNKRITIDLELFIKRQGGDNSLKHTRIRRPK